jgi:DeoR family transcriptional regulator, galactitol utilization operon repressor
MIGKLNEREKEILTILADDTTTSVSDMSKFFKVSPVTIRNDLSSLEEKGFIIRTWGGAFPAFHRHIIERQKNRVEDKNRIAKKAASMIQDGDTIMIEAGTTTALVAKYLLGKRNIHVVTNSLLVISYIRANPAAQLTLIGGNFRPSSESMVGPLALQELEKFHVKTAFVGTDGFTIENGLTTHLVEGAEIVKRMANQAENTVLVADSSKHGKTGFVKVLPLETMNIIITDSNLAENTQALFSENGIEIKIV